MPRSPRVDAQNVRSGRTWSWSFLLVAIVFSAWAAHAIAFFFHEYSHTFVAWLLGWKTSPFDLHVPPFSPTLLLLQAGIDQGVDEAPIFAAGRGADAAWIGAAGLVLGNAILTYPLSRWLLARARSVGSRGAGLFAFLLCTASVGNLIDYVPVRTFTLESDMGSVQRGFGWSPWMIMLVVGVPTLIILMHYLIRIVPRTLVWLFPAATGRRLLLTVIAMGALFGFYGAAGWSGHGPVSHGMSVVSVYVLFPFAVVIELIWTSRVQRHDPPM